MIGNISDWAEGDVSQQTLNNSLRDCTVSDLPVEYHGAVAVSVFIAANTTLEHNEISGSSYSALSVGWGWHRPDGNSSYARSNRVLGNYIHDSMQLLFDGGDVYTLGSQPGSEVAFNHIHGHHGCKKTNAIYHDDGSAHWTDHHNVVQLMVAPTPCPDAAWVSMWTPYVHDCHLYSNFVDSNVTSQHGTNCSVTTTTLFSPQAVPAAAQAIIHAAGPRLL